MKEAFETKTGFPGQYSPELLVLVKGKGVWVEDRAGKSYLDFGAGIAVNALGYGRDDLADAAAGQMRKLIHVSNLYATEPAIELAGKLVKSGPFQAVHFGNSGTEANEAALKYARLYSYRTRGEGNFKLLSFSNCFHGRTLGALSLTFNPKYQDPYKPLIPGCVESAYNDSAALEKILDGSFAAVIVEVVQGEGGLTIMEPGFAGTLNRLCRKHDIILIVDEVQTGLARTGSLYAYQQVGLTPDIVTLAKPLAAGLPLSAALIPAKINELLHIGDHGTTFGGGPVVTALALKVWEILSDDEFIAGVREKGKKLSELLQGLKESHASLGAICGRGLLRGIEVPEDKLPPVLETAQKEGLLILRSGRNVLRIAPPLIISQEELVQGVDILDSVFSTALEK
jgi:acetylornithine/N-succinyldiaminopimelate aminotransferase